ncbi:hypothetical protein TSAR_003156, partial [Trichomalopsis sarcophagae]
MPHVSSSGGGEDLGSEDEVKVFKDEGEDEKRSSENLTEEKSSLIDLTESEEKVSLAGGSYSTGKASARSDLSPVFGKVDPTPHTSSFNMGYLVSPYPYPNGAGGPIPVSMASKMGLTGTHPSGLPSHEGADVPVRHGPVSLPHAQSGNDASRRFLAHAEHVPDLPGERRIPKSLPHESAHQQFEFAQAMEPECLEPLNLVIKKDSNSPAAEPELPEKSSTPVDSKDCIKTSEEDKFQSKIQDNMTILQEAVKSGEAGAPATDQKFLTALYMSSLMQMSNASALRNVSPTPYNVQQNFMQLLAMVEARHRMWQQLSWSVPPNFLRNPVGLPQPYYDGALTNLNEQLCNSPNSLMSYPSLPTTKNDPTSPETKQTFFKRSTIEQKNSSSLPADNTKNQDTGQQNNPDKKKPHIKKPLNAFMLYMKEMRAKVVAECTLKESAAINQILGRRWHSLSREEQQRYYEAARHERQLHQQRYPGWSARDNYGYGSKKKKRKKERSADPAGVNVSNPFLKEWHALGRDEQAKYYEMARRERQLHMQLYPDWSSRANTNRTKKRKRKQDTNSDPGGNNMKKCRARFGLDQQSQWCKPCRYVHQFAPTAVKDIESRDSFDTSCRKLVSLKAAKRNVWHEPESARWQMFRFQASDR